MYFKNLLQINKQKKNQQKRRQKKQTVTSLPSSSTMCNIVQFFYLGIILKKQETPNTEFRLIITE